MMGPIMVIKCCYDSQTAGISLNAVQVSLLSLFVGHLWSSAALVSERDPRSDREVLRERVSGGGDREAARGEPQAEGQLLTLWRTPWAGEHLCPEFSLSGSGSFFCRLTLSLKTVMEGCSQAESDHSLGGELLLPVELVAASILKRTITELPFPHCLSSVGLPRLNTSGASWCCRLPPASRVVCLFVCSWRMNWKCI